MRRQDPQEQRDHDDPAHRDGIGQIHAGRATLSGLWWRGSIIAPDANSARMLPSAGGLSPWARD